MADTGKRKRHYERLLANLKIAQVMQGGSPVTITYWASVADVDPGVTQRAAHSLARMGLVNTAYRNGHLVASLRQARQAVFVWNDEIQQLVPFAGRKRSEAGA